MDVICLEDKAFDALVETVLERFKARLQQKENWISDEEAMKLLNISSKTTLQKLRDEGKISFSQPMKKVISYDRLSILEFLEKHRRQTF